MIIYRLDANSLIDIHIRLFFFQQHHRSNVYEPEDEQQSVSIV